MDVTPEERRHLEEVLAELDSLDPAGVYLGTNTGHLYEQMLRVRSFFGS